jgi:hypothetical protein
MAKNVPNFPQPYGLFALLAPVGQQIFPQNIRAFAQFESCEGMPNSAPGKDSSLPGWICQPHSPNLNHGSNSRASGRQQIFRLNTA